MRLTSFARRRMLAGLAVLAGVTGGGAVLAQPTTPTPIGSVKIDQTGALLVPLGGVVQFELKKKTPPKEFTIKNEEIVVLRNDPTKPNVLILTGKTAGLTQLTVVWEDGKATYDIVVQPDYDLLRRVIRQSVPTANVEVIPGVGNVIILTGYVNKPEDSDTVLRIASSAVGGSINNVINALQLGGAQHVLIDCTIAQVDRTELRERNFAFGVSGTSFGISSVLNGLATSNVATNGFGGTGVLAPPLTAGASANAVVGIVPASTIGALRALRTEGLAKFLSEPKVITQTGRPAILRAGGQQAILGAASGINGPGATLHDVGTTLEVIPIVFGNGKIALDVVPQIRTVNAGRGVTTSFGFTPGFNESSVRSSVVMESGQTYAIGGLLETQVQASTQKVPYLGDMPLLGAAFSSVSYEERETELIILVTPRLVDAMGCNQVPLRVPGKETRTPDDYELFLESLIEAPRGQRQPWVNGKYVPAYKNDRSASQFPCIGPDGRAIPGCTAPAANNGSASSWSMPVASAPATTPAPAPALAVTPTAAPVVSVSGMTEMVPVPVAPAPAPIESANTIPVPVPVAGSGQK